MTNYRLLTDVGVLKLDLCSDNDAVLTEVSLRGFGHYGYGISAELMKDRKHVWTVKDGERILCLPRQYRPSASAVVRSTVAIGCRWGQVLVMQFSANGPEP
ncbi:hypothetical protein FocTR4_00013622 [Fusarium oxysporum f. sp. cubense]|uniref:Uncharacterized protein n=1 Tax=Fusarium oxysporum f. sp. cubense TaxID=61366 RepID=A0A5C6SQL1_FUSOC|nr:hypothetical protein FocTR4_00013622 [Fusarium oxysporum f. sp. cubense]